MSAEDPGRDSVLGAAFIFIGILGALAFVAMAYLGYRG